MFDENSHRLKCDVCGKYMKYQEPGSAWAFVPESDISREEDIEQCKKCTDKWGVPIPFQSVNLEVCTGIVKG